jgi:uncharacterized protein YciI
VDVEITRRHLLLYEYVTENLLERRAPHREGHLALIREWTADGRILMAGAVGDPPTGAVIVFDSDNPAEAERFTSLDPYVANGLVTSWRVEPWSVVA